jgi:hypothetical protein
VTNLAIIPVLPRAIIPALEARKGFQERFLNRKPFSEARPNTMLSNSGSCI